MLLRPLVAIVLARTVHFAFNCVRNYYEGYGRARGWSTAELQKARASVGPYREGLFCFELALFASLALTMPVVWVKVVSSLMWFSVHACAWRAELYGYTRLQRAVGLAYPVIEYVAWLTDLPLTWAILWKG